MRHANAVTGRLTLLICAIVFAAEPLSTWSGQEWHVIAQQLTFGPKHHFFGYIGHVRTIPWNQSGRYILALETDFQDRMPQPAEPANVVLIDTTRQNAVTVVAQTRAWNFQQGTMLYWNPLAPETQFFMNDRDPDNQHVYCALLDISQLPQVIRVREYRCADSPVGNSGVAQQGRYLAAINYGRLARLRPVTGYPGAHDFSASVKHPGNDGVFRIDTQTGEKRLLVSFAQLAALIRPGRPDVDRMELFINHTLWNRAGDRLFFFVRGDFDTEHRLDVPCVIQPDGTALRLLPDHPGGHPEWGEGCQLIGRAGNQKAIYDVDQLKLVSTIGDPSVFTDPGGDTALSPDGRWLVNGWGQQGKNHYVFFRLSDGAFCRSPGIDRGGWEKGELRIDSSPCWNRAGTAVLVPGVASDPERTRQLFLVRRVEREAPQQ